MTPLRQRFVEDMVVRNLAPTTQASYVQQVSMFARHFGKSPELLGLDEIRDYQLYLATCMESSPAIWRPSWRVRGSATVTSPPSLKTNFGSSSIAVFGSEALFVSIAGTAAWIGWWPTRVKGGASAVPAADAEWQTPPLIWSTAYFREFPSVSGS